MVEERKKSCPEWIIDGWEAVNMRETETGDSGQHEGKKGIAERKTRCNMREKMCLCVCACVCSSWRRRKSQWGEREGRASMKKRKTTFANDLHSSFRRPNKNNFPTGKNHSNICLPVWGTAHVKLKQEKPRGKRKKKNCWLWSVRPHLQPIH